VLKKFFIALSFCKILLLQLFPPISHQISRRRSAIYLSLLTPSILSQSDFVKRSPQPEKAYEDSGNYLEDLP
jgi:hypothetical protein